MRRIARRISVDYGFVIASVSHARIFGTKSEIRGSQTRQSGLRRKSQRVAAPAELEILRENAVWVISHGLSKKDQGERGRLMAEHKKRAVARQRGCATGSPPRYWRGEHSALSESFGVPFTRRLRLRFCLLWPSDAAPIGLGIARIIAQLLGPYS